LANIGTSRSLKAFPIDRRVHVAMNTRTADPEVGRCEDVGTLRLTGLMQQAFDNSFLEPVQSIVAVECHEVVGICVALRRGRRRNRPGSGFRH